MKRSAASLNDSRDSDLRLESAATLPALASSWRSRSRCCALRQSVVFSELLNWNSDSFSLAIALAV